MLNMNAVERVCLELCEKIFCTSSVTDKTIVNYSVKLFQDNGSKTAEVILVTKEDEYIFVLDLPEEDVYNEADSHVYHCSKCASENRYNLKCVNIKGFDAIEFGKINLDYLKKILEKLAEDHARCIEENNLEKKIYIRRLFSVSEEVQEPFLDILRRIIEKVNGGNIDLKIFLNGIKAIEENYETALQSDEEYVYVYGNILHKKLFVKNGDKYERDYKILNIRAEQNFPLVYDLLLTIFSFTDQNMRQHHFHDLLDHYYQCLEKKLQKLCLDITKCLPQITFQRQLHQFISYVKLEILKQFCQGFAQNPKSSKRKTSKDNLDYYKTNIWPAILEVNECILYPNLSREDCYKILKNKIRFSDYKLLNYRVMHLEEREGFLGDYFKLKTDIEYKGEVKLFHFFAKYLPIYGGVARQLAFESFKKEEFYYLKFIPELNNFGLGDITNFLPNCYFSRSNEVLVFDDISVMNYKSISVSVSYSYEMLLVTVKELAKIHACSLLYEEILSERTKEVVRLDTKFPEYVEEMAIRTDKILIKKTLDCAIATFLKMLNVFHDIPKKLSMEEFKERGKTALGLCFEKIKKSNKFRNVLCHGDSWSSNILFKTDTDNLPIVCRIIDYQLTRYCSPGHDLFFLLYMSTSKEIRKKFESKLLQEYYTELSHILQKYNVDLKTIYNYQEFLDCCEYMRSQALCHAIMILQVVLFPEEKLNNIFQDKEQISKLYHENRDILIEELQIDGPYTQRMKELAEELYYICENNYYL